MIRPMQPARRKRRRARLALAQALRERRLLREARVLAYLNVRAERHTEERLAEYWSRFPYWAPRPNALLPTPLEKLKSGEADPPLVRAALGEWVDTIDQLPPPPGVPESERDYWIAQRDHWVAALRKIEEGIDANKALGLEVGHRRPGKERDLIAARDAWWLIHRENVSAKEAFAMVAKPLAISPVRVRDLYYEHRDALEDHFSRP
ncbi:hypothetical protein VSR34_09650 [Paraburkholderia sp. JHI2823]|uniref:hypothetical protein n=1 Tax=Paraburkholderia sp. JHI2823 TaxID=3112960 RepID=UPI0031731E9A